MQFYSRQTLGYYTLSFLPSKWIYQCAHGHKISISLVELMTISQLSAQSFFSSYIQTKAKCLIVWLVDVSQHELQTAKSKKGFESILKENTLRNTETSGSSLQSAVTFFRLQTDKSLPCPNKLGQNMQNRSVCKVVMTSLACNCSSSKAGLESIEEKDNH